mgnify:CR=1 FL=1
MDILDLYSRLKNSYKEYISSFVRIKLRKECNLLEMSVG